MKLKIIFLFTWLIVGLVPTSATSEEPLKIGVVYGFSGAAQKWASSGRKGIDLAVSEINESGGVSGRPIEIVYEDNATSPKQSISAYRKLISVDKVSAIIASNWSIMTNPLVPLTRKDKVLVIAPTVVDTSIESESDYFFTMGYRIESIRNPVKKFFEINTTVKTVAFLCWEDAWGRANLKIWEEEAKAQGVKIVDTICQGDYNNDFRTDVTRISSKKPDAVFVAMYPERVSQRMKELRLSSPIFTTSVILEVLGDQQFDAKLFNNMYFAYWPPSEQFEDSYRKKYDEEPILEAHNHYEVIHSLAKGLSASQGDLLRSMKAIKYTGVAGKIDFSSSPFVNYGDGSLMKVTDREFKQVD